MGLGSLLWLLLRSGFGPNRLSYPCQHIAATYATTFLTFQAADLAGFLFPARPLGIMVLLLTILLSGSVPTTAPTIVALMEANGDYFYRTAAHPDGLFGPEDIIVIKVNNQWDKRNATNSDVLKGVIYRLVQHPEGFRGAVIVAENPQGANDDWYNETDGNINSQFRNQSYQEVTRAFAGQGYRVCIARSATPATPRSLSPGRARSAIRSRELPPAPHRAVRLQRTPLPCFRFSQRRTSSGSHRRCHPQWLAGLSTRRVKIIGTPVEDSDCHRPPVVYN